jgi:L-rhamnose mutarotase
MKRTAFTLKLKPGFAEEYRRRHDEIWPELEQELAAAGILEYAIFLDESTHTLFAYQQLADDETTDKLPSSPVVRRWWDYMADIMVTDADNVPVCATLPEMFRLRVTGQSSLDSSEEET